MGTATLRGCALCNTAPANCILDMTRSTECIPELWNAGANRARRGSMLPRLQRFLANSFPGLTRSMCRARGSPGAPDFGPQQGLRGGRDPRDVGGLRSAWGVLSGRAQAMGTLSLPAAPKRPSPGGVSCSMPSSVTYASRLLVWICIRTGRGGRCRLPTGRCSCAAPDPRDVRVRCIRTISRSRLPELLG